MPKDIKNFEQNPVITNRSIEPLSFNAFITHEEAETANKKEPNKQKIAPKDTKNNPG
ncbi:MAG: hypothetical protein ACTSXG_00770 [Alphaproteobacteria bacterium]